MSDVPMSDWELLKIIKDGMAPTGRYSRLTLTAYRHGCRRYERFRGSPQRACEVTPRLIELFRDWQDQQGYNTRTCCERVATVVRFADPNSLPYLLYSEYMSGEKGTLQHFLVNEYFPTKSKIASEKTEKQYAAAVSRYSQHLGRHATLADLNDKAVGQWVRALRNEKLAAFTVNGYLNKIRALWTWCAKKRIVEIFPTIEDVPEPQRIPRAWTESQLRTLVAATARMPGFVGDAPAALWWRCFHFVAFDTGERCSALLSLKWRHFDSGDATLEAPAEIRKGGRKPMLYRLKPATVAELAKLPKSSAVIFEWRKHQGTFYNHYKRLLKLADLPHESHKSGPQKVRRTFASYIEENGGNATAALGHTARKVTEQSYLDPRIIKQTQHNEVLFDL